MRFPSKAIADVAEFHRTYGVPVYLVPHIPTEMRTILRRIRLIHEEYGELIDALLNKNLVEISDALGNLLYVIYRMACEFGIPLDAIVQEIHKSNMSKLDVDGKPIVRKSDGKILKGPLFALPDIKQILILHGWKQDATGQDWK